MLLARSQVGTREIAMGISLEITVGISLEITMGVSLEITIGGQPGDYYGGSAWRLLWGSGEETVTENVTLKPGMRFHCPPVEIIHEKLSFLGFFAAICNLTARNPVKGPLNNDILSP